MLRQPLVKTDSWLCCSQGRFATGRIFDVLGKVHDLGPDLRSIAGQVHPNPRTQPLGWGAPFGRYDVDLKTSKTEGPSNASTDAQLGTTVMGISAVLFHTAWTGAYESFDTNPLIGAGLAHEFSDPQIGRFSVRGVLNAVELPVIRAFSGAYQWLNLAGFTINAELFESHFRFEGLAISCFPKGGLLDRRSAPFGWVRVRRPNDVGLFKVTHIHIHCRTEGLLFGGSTSDLNEVGLLSAFWAAHIGFVSIPAS